MKPQPIENLLSSHTAVIAEIAKSLSECHELACLISVQMHPITVGLISRELGTPCYIEDIGDGMSKYSIDLDIRGEACKVWAVGESISK